MSKNKNNHFVPQFHLRQWSDNGKTIMVYNINKKICINNASIKNQASKNYLYGHNDTFEKMMGKIESYISPLYAKIIKHKNISCLTNDELDMIYLFINLCNERSNTRAEEQSQIKTEVFQEMLKISKQNNDPRLSNISFNDILDVQLTYDNPTLLSVYNIIKYYRLTIDLKCVLIRNNTHYDFFTSDYPTIVYNLFSNVKNIYSGWGMCSGGIIYILPIHPKFALMLYDSIAYDCKLCKNIINVNNKNEINEINKLTILNSEKCIYSKNNTPEKYIVNLLNKLTIKKSKPIQIFKNNVKESLILINRKRINYLAKFNFLKINKDYKEIPIPLSAAGIIRPQSAAIGKELDKYWNNKKTNK